jgi:hypothetical protein
MTSNFALMDLTTRQPPPDQPWSPLSPRTILPSGNTALEQQFWNNPREHSFFVVTDRKSLDCSNRVPLETFATVRYRVIKSELRMADGAPISP